MNWSLVVLAAAAIAADLWTTRRGLRLGIREGWWSWGFRSLSIASLVGLGAAVWGGLYPALATVHEALLLLQFLGHTLVALHNAGVIARRQRTRP